MKTRSCLFCWRPTAMEYTVPKVKGTVPLCELCLQEFRLKPPKKTAADVVLCLKDLAEMGLEP